MLLQLINLGSTTVFQDLTSITIAGLYSSYLIAVSLLLWRRCTGHITVDSDPYYEERTRRSSENSINISPGYATHLKDPKRRTLTNTVNAPLTWGPWHIPGGWGIGLNIIVCCFLLISWFFSFWPMTLPVTAGNMNYSCLLLGGVVVLALIYYAWRGKAEFHGPIIENDL